MLQFVSSKGCIVFIDLDFRHAESMRNVVSVIPHCFIGKLKNLVKYMLKKALLSAEVQDN